VALLLLAIFSLASGAYVLRSRKRAP
jgi:cbb3-type cytochrome oxidase subunit 3